MKSAGRRAFIFSVILFIALFSAGAAFALDPPKGRVVLTFVGKILNANSDGAAVFDRAMLAALPQHTITTDTPWIDSPADYRGPLLRTVLKAVGAAGDELRIKALDDYEAIVPVSDGRDHDVILAMEKDGRPMSVREHGPLFLLYPFDDKPELKNQIIYHRSVWRIVEIEVR